MTSKKSAISSEFQIAEDNEPSLDDNNKRWVDTAETGNYNITQRIKSGKELIAQRT